MGNGGTSGALGRGNVVEQCRPRLQPLGRHHRRERHRRQGFITNTGPGDLTLSGTLSGSNSVTQDGTGTLTLTAANTYSGGTTLNAGSVAITNGKALGTGAVNITGSSASLVIQGTGSFTVVNNIGGSGSITNTGSGNRTLSGTISGSNSIIQDGVGTLDLTGINTYSGGTTLNAGSVAITHGQALGTGAVNIAGGDASLVLGGNDPFTLANNIGGTGWIFGMGPATARSAAPSVAAPRSARTAPAYWS